MLPLGQCLSFLAIMDITEQTAKRCGFIFENSIFLGIGVRGRVRRGVRGRVRGRV